MPISSTSGLVAKRRARSAAARDGTPEHLLYLESEFGITLDKEGPWARRQQKERQQQFARKAKKSLLLFYGRNSSKVGIRSSSDLRQSDEAIRICEVHALGNPADIKIFFDYGISGAALNRPEMDRLIEVIEENWGCILMVEDVDRLVRDEISLLCIGAKLAKGGVRIFTLDGEVSHEEFINKGLEASRERRKLKKRGNPLRRQKIREGAHFHRPAFGYVKIEKGKAKQGPHAKLVKAMFKKYLDGESLSGIGVWLKSKGVTDKRGVAWQANYIRQILEREIYIGIVKTEFDVDDVVRTYHPDLKIVDEEDFAAVQKMLRAKSRKRYAPRTDRGLTFNKGRAFLLGGKCRCPRCGSLMSVSRYQYGKTENHRSVIRCTRNRRQACDSFEGFENRDAEVALIKFIGSCLTPEFDDHYLQAEKEQYENEAQNTSQKRAQIDAAIAKLQVNVLRAGEEEEEENFIDTYRILKDSLSAKVKERDSMNSQHFLGYAQSNLSSLSKELKRLEDRSPFYPRDHQEVRLATQLHKIIRSVIIHRVNQDTVRLDFELDFSTELGRDAESVVIKDSVTYSSKAPASTGAKERVAGAYLRLMLKDKEFVHLRSLYQATSNDAKHNEDRLRNALNVVVVAMELDCPIRHTALGMGLGPIYYDLKRAIDDLRSSSCFEAILDWLADARGELPGRGKVALHKRPERRLRGQLRDLGHKVLDLELAKLNGPDRNLFDHEWAAIRRELVEKPHPVPLGHKTLAFFVGRETFRTHLNELFRVLRGDLTAVAVVGHSRTSSFHRSFRKVLSRGYLSLAAEVLLELERARAID